MLKFTLFKSVLICCLTCLLCSACWSQEKKFVEFSRFSAQEARQGIAVDDKYIYVVGTKEIAKYNKVTKQLIKRWQGKEDGPIIHLDSGVIVDGKLYCAHSNYPEIPMTSSVEIWDSETLEHIDSHSFGIQWGSCTWIDRYDNFWWVTFAHYEKWKAEIGKGTNWTTLIKFDDRWQKLQAWIFPKTVIERFLPMSNSGGSWGSDSLLYCTGHDRSEVYALKLPRQGSVLELVEIIPMGILGQGIAWDRFEQNTIYGIKNQDRLVVAFRLIRD